MTDEEQNGFMPKCLNAPYSDYSWLKEHCYRVLKNPCSPNTRNEHLAVLDLIKEHEEQQSILDKISAEIEEHAKINFALNVDRARALCWCLDVIDKYKAESEEE